jgi:hypothetical protein
MPNKRTLRVGGSDFFLIKNKKREGKDKGHNTHANSRQQIPRDSYSHDYLGLHFF